MEPASPSGAMLTGNAYLVMTSITMSACGMSSSTVTRSPVVVGWLWNRNRWRVLKICRKHQHERRYNAKREKRI